MSSNHRTIPAPRARRAFTLVEAAVATGIASILVVGMGVALLVPVRALDKGDGSAGRQADAAEVMDRVMQDAAVATRIVEAIDSRIELRVPDRTGDGAEETVVYTWSAGAISRTLNGGDQTPLMDNVARVKVNLARRSGPATVESGLVTLAAHNDSPGGSMRSDELHSNDVFAQWVKPQLGANAVSWKIEGVRLRLKRNTSGSTITVRITTADLAKPTATVLSTVSRSGSTIGTSTAWVDFTLPPTRALAPSESVCIVVSAVRTGGGGEDGEEESGSLDMEYEENGSAMPFNTHRLTSSNLGASWSTPTDARDFRFELLGRVTTTAP